jgi:hypothetical protein
MQKKHPVILHPLVASVHPDLPFARIFNAPFFSFETAFPQNIVAPDS